MFEKLISKNKSLSKMPLYTDVLFIASYYIKEKYINY